MPAPNTKELPVVEKRKPPAAGMGRPKGAVNKTTALLKDAILQAAELAGGQEGLVGYLQAQATANPGPFMTLLGKVLPTQVVGDPLNPIEHNHSGSVSISDSAAFLAGALGNGADRASSKSRPN